jgi:hypothetical protein
MSGIFKAECMVCGGKMGYYFTKLFTSYGLGDVEYWKCNECGFVSSKTHHEMDEKKWNELNFKFHDGYQGKETVTGEFERMVERREARLKAQVSAIAHMDGHAMLPHKNKWIDYGCGDGKLDDMLHEKGIEVLKYDKYMSRELPGYIEKTQPSSYDLLINCAVFEHILNRASLEEMFGLITDNGALALHTLACENIPRDPGWFYLLPVHTAFYTNKSMEILFKEFGFRSSVYNVPSRMWFWLKDYNKEKLEAITDGNREEWFYKEGFMDYWK